MSKRSDPDVNLDLILSSYKRNHQFSINHFWSLASCIGKNKPFSTCKKLLKKQHEHLLLSSGNVIVLTDQDLRKQTKAF
jgi:hypothetical protein